MSDQKIINCEQALRHLFEYLDRELRITSYNVCYTKLLRNRSGQQVPQVTFHTRRDHEWVDVTSDEIFKGKTVVVFSLPGAFTPTCSSTHLPRYNELAPAFRANGVDAIVCVFV